VSFAYCKCNLDAEIDSDAVIDIAIGVFKRAIFAMKRGAIRKTFGGYFYRGVLAKLDDLFRVEIQQISGGVRFSVPDDWLKKCTF
jgi:hypothetical protein